MPKYRRLTYRDEDIDHRYLRDMVERLVGHQVVVRMPRSDQLWKRGTLLAVYPDTDRFRVSWSKRGKGRNLVGLWRVHHNCLFDENKLPEPLENAIIRTVKTTTHRRVTMATKATKGKGKAAAESNGRSRDILEDFSEAERKRLAKQVFAMKKDGAKWGEIGEELDLPGERPSVAGRRLLREYHPSGESMIRERAEGSGRKPAAKASAKADTKRGTTRTAAKGGGTKVRVKRGKGRATNP